MTRPRPCGGSGLRPLMFIERLKMRRVVDACGPCGYGFSPERAQALQDLHRDELIERMERESVTEPLYLNAAAETVRDWERDPGMRARAEALVAQMHDERRLLHERHTAKVVARHEAGLRARRAEDGQS